MTKLIPLYDSTADIACTITEAEIPARLALIDDMRSALTALERTEHGMLLHFAADPATETKLRQFAIDEKRCCEFWGFAIASTGNDLSLQWDAPPNAQDLVDRLERFFRGNEPATELKGLL